MPQMAPYNWLNLFFMFSLIYLYLISYIYFLNFKIFFMNKKMLTKNNFFWLW